MNKHIIRFKHRKYEWDWTIDHIKFDKFCSNHAFHCFVFICCFSKIEKEIKKYLVQRCWMNKSKREKFVFVRMHQINFIAINFISIFSIFETYVKYNRCNWYRMSSIISSPKFPTLKSNPTTRKLWVVNECSLESNWIYFNWRHLRHQNKCIVLAFASVVVMSLFPYKHSWFSQWFCGIWII